MRKLLLIGVAALSMLGASATHAADTTLTLACQGEVLTSNATRGQRKEPISLSVIIDLTARTIAGFSLEKLPLNVLQVRDTMTTFAGSTQIGHLRVSGAIDRVTGDLDAEVMHQPWSTDPKGETTIERYSLKCKPAQRMW
jgi:hypothetical protein